MDSLKSLVVLNVALIEWATAIDAAVTTTGAESPQSPSTDADHVDEFDKKSLAVYTFFRLRVILGYLKGYSTSANSFSTSPFILLKS